MHQKEKLLVLIKKNIASFQLKTYKSYERISENGTKEAKKKKKKTRRTDIPILFHSEFINNINIARV